jgi:HSP90 family molecular chaperone
MDKNYFLTRLANGEDMDAIGQEMAAMMNAAMVEHNANLEAEAKRQAEAEKESAKRELVEEMCEIMKELAILEGIDPDEIEITSDMVDQIMEGITASFQLARQLEKMFAAAPTQTPVKATKIAPTDDQILADFLKMFN